MNCFISICTENFYLSRVVIWLEVSSKSFTQDSARSTWLILDWLTDWSGVLKKESAARIFLFDMVVRGEINVYTMPFEIKIPVGYGWLNIM